MRSVLTLMFSAIAILVSAAETPNPLPAQIKGTWHNQGWQNTWQLSNFDVAQRTARATLGRGGDSCGFDNVPATIKGWDGKRLTVEVSKSCRFPVTFDLEQNGSDWSGSIDNDVRTVMANGKS